MQAGEPEEDQVDWPETYEIEIYKIQHKTDEKLERYVGCTKHFKARRTNHKTACTNPNVKGHNYPLYKYIREHGGWGAWQMESLATEYVENKHEQSELENLFIQTMGATLCQYKPGALHRSGGRKEHDRQRTRERDAKLGLHGNSKPCPCGGKHTKKNELIHKRSLKHKRYEASLPSHQETNAPTTTEEKLN